MPVLPKDDLLRKTSMPIQFQRVSRFPNDSLIVMARVLALRRWRKGLRPCKGYRAEGAEGTPILVPAVYGLASCSICAYLLADVAFVGTLSHARRAAASPAVLHNHMPVTIMSAPAVQGRDD